MIDGKDLSHSNQSHTKKWPASSWHKSSSFVILLSARISTLFLIWEIRLQSARASSGLQLVLRNHLRKNRNKT